MLNMAISNSNPNPMENDNWHRLRDIIRKRSYSEGATTKLASGDNSSFYFNMKMTMSQPEALNLIADLTLEALRTVKCDFVGGLEMGAVPILNAVAVKSYLAENPIPMFWVRKEAKTHGTQNKLEGELIEKISGNNVVMVDDVTTTGGSVLKAINEARNNGAIIDTVITIVDRLEGARENLKKHGIELICLYDASEFRS